MNYCEEFVQFFADSAVVVRRRRRGRERRVRERMEMRGRWRLRRRWWRWLELNNQRMLLQKRRRKRGRVSRRSRRKNPKTELLRYCLCDTFEYFRTREAVANYSRAAARRESERVGIKAVACPAWFSVCVALFPHRGSRLLYRLYRLCRLTSNLRQIRHCRDDPPASSYR